MATKNQTQKLGFVHDPTKTCKSRYYLPCLDAHFYIYKDTELCDLLKVVVEKSLTKGMITGKQVRSKEISELLAYDETKIEI